MSLFKFLKLVRSGSRSLMHQKLRAGLSISGIICGITAVFTMICIGEGAKREALRQIGELGVRNIIIKEKKLTKTRKGRAIKNLSSGLSLKDVKQIESVLPSLQQIGAIREVSASTFGISPEFSPSILATTPGFFKIKELSLFSGRRLSDTDLSEQKMVAVIGDDVAMKLGKGGKLGQNIRIENSLFTIIGILDTVTSRIKKNSPIAVRNFNQAILLPLGVEKTIDSSRQFRPELSEIIVQTKSRESVLPSSKTIARGLRINHSGVDDYSIIVPGALLRKMNEAQLNFNILLGSIAAISLLVGGIGIMNIMLATVSERRKEIGIRRAVGASQVHILIQFLSESLLLTLTGGFIGLFLGVIIVRVLALYSAWDTAIVPGAVFLSMGMALLTGIFFGIYPAFHASRVDPIVALRYE